MILFNRVHKINKRPHWLYTRHLRAQEHAIPSMLGRVSLPTSSHLRLPARCMSLSVPMDRNHLDAETQSHLIFSSAGDVCPWRLLPQPGLGPEQLVCPFKSGASQKIDPVVTAGKTAAGLNGVKKNVRRRGVYPLQPASSSVSDLRRASSGEVSSEA